MCRMHADDTADFEGERIPFALSVGDADNIDRFDAFRTHTIPTDVNYISMNSEDRKLFLHKNFDSLNRMKNSEFGTETAKQMIGKRCNDRYAFFKSLENQINLSEKIILD